MCGLGGVARIGNGNRLSSLDELVLKRMLGTLAHRGPDDSNLLLRGAVGLAFSRLSLVGVTSGMQPFISDDDLVALMANGEVYNHRELEAGLRNYRLKTRSDCEVLLPLYERDGLNFMDKIRGILAVAIHDAVNNRIVLAVDAFANKPMFYTRTRDLLVFGSEIKALFDHPDVDARIDWAASLNDQGLASYPAFSHQSPNTWFAGVNKVNAGTVVTIDLDTGIEKITTFWSPTFPELGDLGESANDAESLISEYRRLLFRSVEDSLMAEVGLGLFLSGGIDSAAIAAIASELGSPLRTFTVATEATILNGDVCAACTVADHLGVENTVATLRVADIPSPTDWQRLLWLMESPQAGPEQLYKFSLHRIAKDVHPELKAMLLGAGADEFNGGYTPILSGNRGWDAAIANLAVLDGTRTDAGVRWWSGGPQRSLLRTDPEGVRQPDATVDHYANYVKWKYRDVQQYNCWLEDRCAAGNGIEARVPFLDTELVDLSTRVPVALRSQLLWDKAMTREAMRGLLPESIVAREKKPFFDGRTARFAHQTVRTMLRQDEMALVEMALGGPRMADYIDADAMRGAIQNEDFDLHPEILLRIVNLGLLDLEADAGSAPFYAEQVRLRARVTDKSAIKDEFSSLLPASTTVLSYAADTTFAKNVSSPGGWLLLRGHEVLYTIDEDEAPDWIRFLENIDGSRSIGQIADDISVDWEARRDYLEICLEQGLLLGAAGVQNA